MVSKERWPLHRDHRVKRGGFRWLLEENRSRRMAAFGRFLPLVTGSNRPGAALSQRQRSAKSAPLVLVKGQLTCCKDVSCMPGFLLDLRPFADLTLTWMINSNANRVGL